MSEITIKTQPDIKSGTSKAGKDWSMAKFLCQSDSGKEFNVQCWGQDDIQLLRNCTIGNKITCHIDPKKTLYTVGALRLIGAPSKSEDLIDDDIPF